MQHAISHPHAQAAIHLANLDRINAAHPATVAKAA